MLGFELKDIIVMKHPAVLPKLNVIFLVRQHHKPHLQH